MTGSVRSARVGLLPGIGCHVVSSSQRRLWALAGGLATAFLLAFVLLEPVMPGALARPGWLASPTPTIAAGAVALLAGDVVLPVPSSMVMVANGAVFGVVVGTLLSTLGATLSALVGHTLGRATRTRSRRWLGSDTARRLDDLLDRHGMVAVVATRPVPIVAEVVAILAGHGSLPLGRFVAAAVMGAAGTSVVYAVAGALAFSGAGWIPLAVAGFLAGAMWLVGHRTIRPAPPATVSDPSHIPASPVAASPLPGSTSSLPPSSPSEHP